LQIFPPGVRFPTGEFPAGMRGAPETSDKRWRAQAYLVATGWRGHQWRLGAGVERLDLYRVTEGRNFRYAPNGLPIPLPGGYTQEGDLFLYPQTRDHRHVYLQDEWQLAPDWHLTAGLRYDHYDDVGGSTNPRLALVWNARHDLTLKALHGRAYRAPSFAELYSFSNPVARGNPAIRPETVGTSELVLHWQPDNRLQLQLNLFRFRMEDIIRPTPNNQPGTGTTFNNAGGQLGRGGEAELRWQLLPTLQLQASHAWQRGRDLLTGGRPGYAPEQRSMLGLDWRLQTDWRLGLQLLKVGERARPAGDSRPLLRGYLSADLGLRWTPAAQPWSLALQLRNLGNADVREPSLAPGRVVNDLPQAPRSLGLEASWKL
jgi:iron complex outermembrane receptor protein